MSVGLNYERKRCLKFEDFPACELNGRNMKGPAVVELDEFSIPPAGLTIKVKRLNIPGRIWDLISPNFKSESTDGREAENAIEKKDVFI